MSETINGSKSSNYIKDQVPGIDNSSDSLTHQSVQNLWNGRGAADVLIHGLYKPSVVAMTIEAGSVRRKLVITAHGANEGDFVKITTGASAGEEIAIVKVVDTNTIVIAKEVNASIADSIEIWRAVTPAYNADGSLNVSVVPSPIQYNRKTAGVTAAVTVLEDLDTPSASKPMPVSIHSIDGAGITVNAGDLSVSINHVNDSVAIGDGVRLASVTVANELNVSLPASQIATLTPPAAITNFALETGGHLASLDTKLPSQGQALAAASIPVVLTAAQEAALTPPAAITGFSTLAEQQTQTTALGTLDTSVNSLLKPASTLNKVSTVDTITNTVTVSGTVTANAGTNLNTSTLAIESGGNLDSINGKIPSNLTVSSTRLLVDGSGVTQPVSGSVTANIGTVAGLALDTNIDALRVLTGAVTETAPVSDTASSGLNGRLQRIAQRLTSLIALFPSALGQGTMATSFKVVLPSDQSAIPIQSSVGRAKINQIFNDYSITPVTTASYVQLIASTSAVSNRLEIFDSSGEVLIIAVGAAASEVDQFYVFPGGNGVVDLIIPAASRISIKAKTTTASAGLLVLNLHS